MNERELIVYGRSVDVFANDRNEIGLSVRMPLRDTLSSPAVPNRCRIQTALGHEIGDDASGLRGRPPHPYEIG